MLRLNKYQYIGEIGKGTYGTIEIYKKDQQEVVVKRMIVSDSLSQVIREIEIYKKIQHPNIVNYIDHKYGATSLLMLERGRCTLSDFINQGKYNLDLYHRWTHQIISAIDYLHYHNLIHTDLKPPNIIMFRGSNQEFFPKLCDLGCCQIHMPDRVMSCYIQTENYRSPEIKKYLDRKHYHGSYDHKIDIWSLGIIMVDLLCHRYSYGKLNYYSPGHLERLTEFCQNHKYFDFPTELLEIIRGCLAHDPTERWTTGVLLSQSYWKGLNLNLNLSNPDEVKVNTGVPVNDKVDAGVPGNDNFDAGVPGNDNFDAGEPESNVLVPNLETSVGSESEIETPTAKNSDLILKNSNRYLAKSKNIFRYPLQDRQILDLITSYYQELPERLVIDAYYYSLKLRKRNLKINQWRLIQYCIYILSLLYFDQLPGMLSSIFQYQKKDIFQILNHSHDLILF